MVTSSKIGKEVNSLLRLDTIRHKRLNLSQIENSLTTSVEEIGEVYRGKLNDTTRKYQPNPECQEWDIVQGK